MLMTKVSNYDLFNRTPNFNYKKMNHNLEVTKLENPFVQIVWEDFAQNFTQEKIKSVRHYFQKKYNTTNVNVITKSKNNDTDNLLQTVDISFNLLDKNYQLELIKSFLKSKSNEKSLDKILEFEEIVNNKLISNNDDVRPFKRWDIKNIEFSNFLSYGQNQRLDFDKCSGITVVESTPSNFGGKSVLTVDLLLFLFFNETTKTTKAEEIFNKFTSVDKVNVKGEVEIDGDVYIIIRKIERKKSKNGEWNVKTELDFFKKLSDGSLQNFTGEQRRETENFLKSSIGTKEDFLMTILTTATNLEDLIDSKPTARGQVLSRFMGLDFLKSKEEIGKELYSDFSKSMMSNIYNSEQLKTDNEENLIKINDIKSEVDNLKIKLIDVQERLIKGQQYRDGLLNNKHTNIDIEITSLQPSLVNSEITSFNQHKLKFENDIKIIKVLEPSSFYYEEEHDKIKEEYNEKLKLSIQFETKIDEITKLQKSVDGGIKCEHCGIELMNAALTKSKINDLAGLVARYDNNNKLMQDLSIKEKLFIHLKKEFDEYEKNKLIREKLELNIESLDLKILNLQEKLKKYYELQDKINENGKLESLIIKAGIRLDELENEKNNINNSVSNYLFQIKTLNDKILSNKKIITGINEESEKEKIYKIYLEIYGKNGVSKSIMKTMMPLLNSELQRILESSCHFRLEIIINEKNEVEFLMIDNNTQIEKLISSGSGYERTIASLALRAVLSKICSLPRANIIVFDEVFGKISNENLDMVSEFFIKIKDYFEKIFIITHNPLVSNWGDNTVKIQKINNISQVTQ